MNTLFNSNKTTPKFSIPGPVWRNPPVIHLQLSKSMWYHVLYVCPAVFSLQRHHNGHDGISNHQPHDCLLNHLFGCRSKKTSKLHVTGICTGNSLGTGEFPAQMASNAENVSIDDIILLFIVDFPIRRPNCNCITVSQSQSLSVCTTYWLWPARQTYR